MNGSRTHSTTSDSPIIPTGSRSMWVRTCSPRWRAARRPRSAPNGSQRAAKPTVISPIGTFHKNEARQPQSGPSQSISRPVMDGAIATDADTTTPNSANARARRRPEKYCRIMPLTCGDDTPAPTPWSSRMPLSSAGVWASEQPSEPSVNSATPITK